LERKPLIAIFCNSFPPEVGGAPGRIYNLAVLLRNAGYRVQVISAMPNYPTGKIFSSYRAKVIVDEVVDGITVKRVWLSPSNSASALSRGWSMLSFVLSLKLFAFRQIRRQKPALVIVSSPPLPMASTAVRYFRKYRFKVLLNVSDIWPLSANALGVLNKSKLYARLERTERWMYEAATAISAQSNETLKHIQAHCSIMPQHMLYRNLPAVLDTSIARYDALPEGKLRIIYPGVLGHAQGLLALCTAINFNALGVELHIYGGGPELPAIQSLISLNQDKGVVLHPAINADDLARVFREAHAVLIPLVAEIEGALPSKLFAAMQAGIPVFFSGGGEGAAIVNEHHLGWTAAPGDYATIARQIEQLKTMSAEDLMRWRQEIKAVADAHFNKEAQDKDFLRFLSTLIDKNKAG
jgi:glycosyltransferase involved in cell wall biosynthesis